MISRSVLFCLVLLGVGITTSTAQDITYARKVVDTLCSPSIHGRGYVEQGERKAADFIAEEFSKMGLKSFEEGTYFQEFVISVNTFPDKMNLWVDGKKLKPGKEYYIEPASRKSSGQFKPIFINRTLLESEKKVNKLLKNQSKKAVLVSFNEEHYKEMPTSLKDTYDKILSRSAITNRLVISDKKLHWHIQQRPIKRTTFTVSKSALSYVNANEKKPIKKVKWEVDQKWIKKYPTQNVIAYVEGKDYPDQYVVFSAHYDHIGRMGKDTYIPGANDNASGTAMLLNMAKHYAENPPKYTTVFIAFGGEEAGLLGSSHYIENPLFPYKNIRFLLNTDIVGTGDDGIGLVNATEFPEAYQTLVTINEEKNYLKRIKKRGKAANSDHWPFFEKGVPCFFIYTMGGIQAYHDIYDRSETLPLTEFEDLFRLLTDFVDSLEADN